MNETTVDLFLCIYKILDKYAISIFNMLYFILFSSCFVVQRLSCLYYFILDGLFNFTDFYSVFFPFYKRR